MTLEANDAQRIQNYKEFNESLEHIRQKPKSLTTSLQIELALAALASKEVSRLDEKAKILEVIKP